MVGGTCTYLGSSARATAERGCGRDWFGSRAALVAAAPQTRAAGDSSRTETGLAGTAALYEYMYAPLHCSGL